VNKFGLFDDLRIAVDFVSKRQELLDQGFDLEKDSDSGKIKVWGLGCPIDTPKALRLHPPV